MNKLHGLGADDHIINSRGRLLPKYFLLSFILFVGTANAAIINETWSGRVAGNNYGNALLANQFISWSLTYDDQSTTAVTWWDGANRTADFGEYDDYVMFTRIAGVGFDDDKDMISIAKYNFGGIFTALQDGRAMEDHWDRNTAQVAHSTTDTQTAYNYIADGLEFYAFADDETQTLEPAFVVWLADGEVASLHLWEVSRVISTVPVPSALYLFGSSVLGLIAIFRVSSRGSVTPPALGGG